MKTQILIASGILLAALANVAASVPAQAKTEKECAAEWKQMKADNQTAGKKRKDFITECRGNGTAPPTTTPSSPPTASNPPPAPKTTTRKPAAPPPAVTGNIVFPPTVSPKYSKDTAGKQRMETCLDQYKANKANNANGGLKWIQKGGGYYSECNKHLKGSA